MRHKPAWGIVKTDTHVEFNISQRTTGAVEVIFIIGCECGGKYTVRDTRKVGMSLVHRIKCDSCPAKSKIVKPLDANGKQIPDLILDSSNSVSQQSSPLR
ncbi:MAG: hypothetical protein IT422_13875 [Pirellulaceae bacterium]|nr:hypothetical protein [Pirellulaceae bacterium]